MNGKRNEIQCQRVTEVLATRCNRRQERESRNYPTRAAGKRESTVNTLLEPPRNRVTREGGKVGRWGGVGGGQQHLQMLDQDL